MQRAAAVAPARVRRAARLRSRRAREHVDRRVQLGLAFVVQDVEAVDRAAVPLQNLMRGVQALQALEHGLSKRQNIVAEVGEFAEAPVSLLADQRLGRPETGRSRP